MGRALIVYYSWVGNTAAVARQAQARTGFDLRAIEEKKPRKLGTYARAALAGFFGIGGAIQPMDFAMAAYDRILLGVQIWAGKTPPAVTRFIRQADWTGKRVWLLITKSDDCVPPSFLQRLTTQIERRGGHVVDHFAVTTKIETVIPVADFRDALDVWLAAHSFADAPVAAEATDNGQETADVQPDPRS